MATFLIFDEQGMAQGAPDTSETRMVSSRWLFHEADSAVEAVRALERTGTWFVYELGDFQMVTGERPPTQPIEFHVVERTG